MGSLRSDGRNPKAEEHVCTQVCFGGFDESVDANKLVTFLEQKAGAVLRCRVKKTSTPPDSFPDLHTASAAVDSIWSYFLDRSVAIPHAFVHFANRDFAKRALAAAGRLELILDGCVLRVVSSIDNSRPSQQRQKLDPFKFSSVGFELGTHVSRDEFWTAWKCPSGDFIVDPLSGCCYFLYSRKETTFSSKGNLKTVTITCDFKLRFLVRDLDGVTVWKDDAASVLLLNFSSAPLVYYRTADDDLYESPSFSLLDDGDPWIRTTDFTPSGAIGRCTTFRISLPPSFEPKLQRALAYLKDHRVQKIIPIRALLVCNEPGYGVPMVGPFFCIHSVEGISFRTLFMLNAVLHKGIFNQHQMTDNFLDLLRNHSDSLNDAALRHIWNYKRPIFDAFRRLKLVQNWISRKPKLANGPRFNDSCVEVRRLVITPTRAHCLPPEVEVSNRVLRQFKHLEDRFLRVTFTDESMYQLNFNAISFYVAPIVRAMTFNGNQQNTTIFKRVQEIAMDGFELCGRKYYFLAFSSNQLRDQSAWFFADTETITVNTIIKWMGKFTNKNVAKYASRMGQCFSSTHATVNVLPHEVDSKLEDIVRNGYVFSDGIGKMTPELGMQVAEMMNFTDYPPSAYQIRYAGFKGVIAIWPGKDDGIHLSLRPSMNKFSSTHTVLEIVSWTRFQPGYINRQILILLSALGIHDDVFTKMQKEMICRLDNMFVDMSVALEVLTCSCLEQSSTAAMMLVAGFKPTEEPHLKDMLLCVRAAQLRDLLSKARIFVPNGRWLMGCLDELGILDQGQCFIRVSTPLLENCFQRKGSRFMEMKKGKKTVVGTVVVAKNPCLHPGDVRVLEAVDIPELYHLVDCLVFPQNGERPHANEASGSDLDGDLYFVTWEPSLIPPGKKCWTPFHYKQGKSKLQPHDVTHQDVIQFFVTHIVTANLGVICNAHLVHADLHESGAMDKKCIELAELAAIAVDFPKTGIQVTMPASLKPTLYPDFMEKPEHQSYKSKKVLGRLYRSIKTASYESSMDPELTCSYENIPFDEDLVVMGVSEYLEAAWDNKFLYDSHVNALLGQYSIKSEAEVVVGHIISMPSFNSRKQGDLKERIKTSFKALHREFRQVFEALEPEEAELPEAERSLCYERKASAWYVVTYHPCWLKIASEWKEPDGSAAQPRLSFPWIAADYLCGIKVKARE